MSSGPDTSPELSELSSKPPTVLVVEDERAIAEFIRLALEQGGFHVAVAFNGAEALDIVYARPIDLVLLDVMMPVMSGYEVCKRLKTQRKYNHVPIIMLTARRQRHDIIEGIRTGADRYITKPFRIPDLLQAARDELDKAKSRNDGNALRQTVTFTIQSELRYLYEVNDLVSQLYDSTNLSDDDIINIRLSLDELGTNAIKHGNKEDAQKSVTISYSLFSDRLEITIEDEGEGFDLNKVPDPTASDRLLVPSGRGVFLAQQLMDRVEYCGCGNRVVFTKFLTKQLTS